MAPRPQPLLVPAADGCSVTAPGSPGPLRPRPAAGAMGHGSPSGGAHRRTAPRRGGRRTRWWAVGQIGVISRTRSTRLGPLITSGPFALCRNPLYVGNLVLWAGFTVWSGLLWMLPVTVGVFAAYYASIIGWEESLLADRYGDAYRAYCDETPRWRPRLDRLPGAWSASAMHPWREVAFSERGTLIAIAAASVLLVLRMRV